MEFPAKVDWWFHAAFYGGGVLMLALGALLKNKPDPARILLGVLGAVFIGIGFTTSATSYAVTSSGDLESRGFWSTHTVVRVNHIQSIEPSSDARASEAASLDRLRLDCGGGRIVFIAVHDEQGLLSAIVDASDSLRLDGLRVTRGPG